MFPSEFEKPEQSPGFLLWQVSNQWQRLQREALAKLDLTHVQFVLLASTHWLEQQQEVSQSLLAEHAKTDPMMTSQVVRTLEKKGLIVRAPHPTDARARRLETTVKGRKILKEAMKVVEKMDKLYFSKLEGGVKTLNSLLLNLIK